MHVSTSLALVMVRLDGMVWTVWYDMVWCDMVWYGVLVLS